MPDDPPICPKHNIPYRLRSNVTTGEIALACFLCDIEAHSAAQEKDDKDEQEPSTQN